jgi:hypothetical protein
MKIGIDGRGVAPLFLAKNTEHLASKSASQRNKAASGLVAVRLHCLRCGHHGSQVWYLPPGIAAVPCWKCGARVTP